MNKYMVVDKNTNEVVKYFSTWDDAKAYEEAHKTTFNDLITYQDITDFYFEQTRLSKRIGM